MRRRLTPWDALVPVVALAAGLLFATSGQTARGTDLRAGEVTELSAADRASCSAANDGQDAVLGAAAGPGAGADRGRGGQQRRGRRGGRPGRGEQEASAGFTAMSGPGVEITLDDAPETDSGTLPRGATPDAWSSTSPTCRAWSTRCGRPVPTG